MKDNFVISGIGNVTLEIPDTCIHCHKSVGLIMKSKTSPIIFDGYQKLGITFICPNCNQFSVYEYNNSEVGYGYFKLINYSYQKKVNIVLPTNIDAISEQFVEIYTQAETAEAYNLMSICGVAYRKAAEFLIKDYVIMKQPEQESKIKKDALGKVISEQLSDFPKLQTLAKATAWIGNDETHYVRKHDDKDLNDLKAFLLAAATFIAADYDAEQALAMVSK